MLFNFALLDVFIFSHLSLAHHAEGLPVPQNSLPETAPILMQSDTAFGAPQSHWALSVRNLLKTGFASFLKYRKKFSEKFLETIQTFGAAPQKIENAFSASGFEIAGVFCLTTLFNKAPPLP